MSDKGKQQKKDFRADGRRVGQRKKENLGVRIIIIKKYVKSLMVM